MSTTKQVKVDNWGVFFLQRLKHFFNRTDYCDLTLQFQDYAQLKVHRLVLNACTEYFELLERTCEMYDDCLIMPDDLQVDVVVPIVNFMYTGQLEYEYSLYDRLYSTAQIMNMTVLTKLLDAQKGEALPKQPKKEIFLMNEHLSNKKISPNNIIGSFPKNFSRKRVGNRKQYGPGPGLKVETLAKGTSIFPQLTPKPKFDSPRPTRYEVPEELENEDIFESSFADISYESRPLMKLTKNRDMRESGGRVQNIYDEASCSRKFEELQRGTTYKRPRSSSSDTPDVKHIDLEQVSEFTYQQKLRSEYIAQDEQSDDEIFDNMNMDYEKDASQNQMKEDPNLLFSQMNENAADNKSKFSTMKDPKSNFNHAKIISEVLKKYPHLVKNNKNIKLKIMSGTNKSMSSPKNSPKSFPINQQKRFATSSSMKILKDDDDVKPDWTYVNKNMNSEVMAKLVSLGAANISGPWLCLMCGTPGKALNFCSYHKYYQHLVGVHKEKISANICEYCGYKSGKKNHLLHHLYTKHNVPPPSTHSFPKCNQCSYIALTEAFLIKHKLSHLDNREFSCNVCNALFRTRSQMLFHIQISGHKISPDRKASNQCVYCNKIFLRETNLYTHLKLAHKELARKDGIIDNSDEEEIYDDELKYSDNIGNKYSQEEHVSIKEEYDGKIQIISNVLNKPSRNSQKILNSQLLNKNAIEQVRKSFASPVRKLRERDDSQNVMHMMEHSSESEALGNVASGIATSLGLVDRIVVLNDNEYILQSEQGDTIEQSMSHVQVGIDNDSEMILSDLPGDTYTAPSTLECNMPQFTSAAQILSSRIVNTPPKLQPARSFVNQNQPIQIVVSGNQQYKNLPSTAPVVYTTNNESKVSNSATLTKFIEPQSETVQLQSTPDGTVMVLQDQDFSMTCEQNIPTDGSNIVVVYSHPLESEDKDFVQVNNENQFTEGEEHQFESENQEVESHVEHLEEDQTESENILSDQGLVHETVETWQEDAIEPSQEDDGKCDSLEVQEEISLSQELSDPIIEDHNVTISDECNVPCDIQSEDILTENTEIVTAESNEVIISAQESENQLLAESSELDSAVTVENEEPSDLNVEEVSSSVDQVNICIEEPVNELSPTQQDDIDPLHENVIILDTEEAMEVVQEETNIIETEVAVESSEIEGIGDNVEKLASEWSDEEMTLKKVPFQESETSETVEEEISPDQPMEVEESIENIEKEVQKHIQEKERDAESKSDSPTAELSPEDTGNNETEVKDQAEDNGHDLDTSNTSYNSDSGTRSTLKQKTVEKISTLLNDWEDNDSQPEVMETDGKKSDSTVQKDTNIVRLVSDWDDDDDK